MKFVEHNSKEYEYILVKGFKTLQCNHFLKQGAHIKAINLTY